MERGEVDELRKTIEDLLEQLTYSEAALSDEEVLHKSLYPADEWREHAGNVLWWHMPIQEPPFVGPGPGMGECNADGTPTTCARLLSEGWLTHWSYIPKVWEPRP